MFLAQNGLLVEHVERRAWQWKSENLLSTDLTTVGHFGNPNICHPWEQTLAIDNGLDAATIYHQLWFEFC
jgi:hypothetical protein